jgi:hypothetical protein
MKKPVFSKAAHYHATWECKSQTSPDAASGAQSAQRGIAEFIDDFCGTRVRDARGSTDCSSAISNGSRRVRQRHATANGLCDRGGQAV